MSVSEMKQSKAQELLAEAQREIDEENSKRAKAALKSKLAALEVAKRVVANLEREIEDLSERIDDGSYSS